MMNGDRDCGGDDEPACALQIEVNVSGLAAMA